MIRIYQFSWNPYRLSETAILIMLTQADGINRCGGWRVSYGYEVRNRKRTHVTAVLRMWTSKCDWYREIKAGETWSTDYPEEYFQLPAHTLEFKQLPAKLLAPGPIETHIHRQRNHSAQMFQNNSFYSSPSTTRPPRHPSTQLRNVTDNRKGLRNSCQLHTYHRILYSM
jgi:hypothetical protein